MGMIGEGSIFFQINC